MNEDIVKELVGDARAIAELEKEWDQLGEDRLALRQIFPSGESKVCATHYVGILDHFSTPQACICQLRNSCESFRVPVYFYGSFSLCDYIVICFVLSFKHKLVLGLENRNPGGMSMLRVKMY